MAPHRRLVPATFLVALVAASASALTDAPQSAARAPAGTFLVKPYLQLGDAPAHGPLDGLQVLWQTGDEGADWTVEYRDGADRPWRKAAPPAVRRVAMVSIAPHRVYRASLAGLRPGAGFEYRLSRSGHVVFTANARAPRGADQPYRFVAFGDCGANTGGQKAVAHQTYLMRPDFVMLTGDVVYSKGRVSEYREKYWPIYNAEEASPERGAPLLRSTLFIAAPGNHDIASRDFEKEPDSLAYFVYWSQPLNGPREVAPGVHSPHPKGPEAARAAFAAAAGPAFPRMSNFSFDYGNAHWTVLDANPYVDWTDKALRGWVERDLAAARGATWRFVAFHHPGFNSSKKHFDEQRMRLMAEVFEAGGVDVVFSGHVHNYQRTFPLRFVPRMSDEGKAVGPKGRVAGAWTLDRSFDGRANTRPEGVIYLVTGAGGAGLYDPEQQDDPGSWQEFTHKFVSKVHSLTVADVDSRTLTVRQVSKDGQELDRFVVTK